MYSDFVDNHMTVQGLARENDIVLLCSSIKVMFNYPNRDEIIMTINADDAMKGFNMGELALKVMQRYHMLYYLNYNYDMKIGKVIDKPHTFERNRPYIQPPIPDSNTNTFDFLSMSMPYNVSFKEDLHCFGSGMEYEWFDNGIKCLIYNKPRQDPITGKKIKIGSDAYQHLVNEYGEPKIRSPKTNNLITVNKITYNKLLKEGYTENELLSKSITNKMIILNDFNDTKMEGYFNTSITLLPDEIILEEILNNTNIDNFINICKANKRYYEYCRDDLFWEKLYYKYYDNSQMFDDTKSYYETFKLCYRLDYLIKKLKLNYSIYDLYNTENLLLYNKILSEIPKEIGQLQKLKRLALRNNKLNEIPKEIGQLQKLKRLDLSYNKLSEIPKEIGLLLKLQFLDLSDNKLSEIPKEIRQLQNLQELYLNNNELSEIPKEIVQLQKLKSLDLSDNNLSEIPKEIGQLQKLQFLDLSYNKLSEIPKEIGQFRELKELNLRNNKLSDIREIPKEIRRLEQLQGLYIKI
jgi:Leucine-rich repeat (LRR) protein